MSKTRNNFFLYIISFLKYSIILLSLMQLPKVKSSTEINLIIKTVTGEVKFLGDAFPDPSKVYINGEDKGSIKVLTMNQNYYNFTIIYNNDINTCANMFKLTYGMEEITIVSFKNLRPVSMANMFQSGNDWTVNHLKKIVFQNIDTSAVTDMSHMFEFARAIEQIDLSNLNTASVTTIHSMFRECNNLKVIDARSFDTSKVTNMYDMFGYCKSLVYVDLSSFDTKNVQVMQGMFFRCESLKYLDISNFDFSTIVSRSSNCNSDDCRFHLTFAYCTSLEYLNFKTFYINDKLNDGTFDSIPSSTKFWVNETNIHVNSLKAKLKDSSSDPVFIYMADHTKIFDISQNKYVDTCPDGKFEYNNLCWK